MNDFTFYFDLGWQHIISWDALDHILFITTLAAIYLVKNWKQVLILVTAFTIGHSVTLALSVYEIIRAKAELVEFLIPITIVATSLFNLLLKQFDARSFRLNYLLALFFGLIHGLGFANTIRFLLTKDQQLTVPLLSFNMGLEAGQIVLVIFILLLSYLVVNKLNAKREWWIWTLSGITLLWSAYMAVERWPF